jgi:hypothetical protein
MTWSFTLDTLARLALTSAVLLMLFGLYRFARLIPRWRMAARLYGPAQWSVGVDVYQFAKFGQLGTLRWIINLGLFVALLPFIAEAVYASFEYRYMWDGGRWHWIAWVVLPFAYMLVRAAFECELAIPPAVLLLGPSSPELERELSALNCELPHCRTLALLRPGVAQLAGTERWSVYANNLRTRDLYQWRSIVFQLMDVAPLIVLCNDVTKPVVEECRRIERREYQPRTFETTRERLADPSEHEKIMTWLTKRLSTCDDQEVRCERQLVFHAMRGIMPAHLRYPRTVEEFVERAAGLLKFGLYRFLKFCKQLDKPPGTVDLMEDLPSAASRAEELRFLRDDRVFEEMDILFDSVDESVRNRGLEQDSYLAELAVKRDEAAQVGQGGFLDTLFDGVETSVLWARQRLALKRANLAVKRGQLARYRGEWESAEKTLREAAAALVSCCVTTDSFVANESFCELGTTYYYLGDIALAKHRESGDPQLLVAAERNFRDSMKYDEQGGGDTSNARRRLALLTGSALPKRKPDA